MKARVESGFWVFRAPTGYKHVNAKGGGKILVPDEPMASTVREALQGYADGRFVSQAEVQRFLESDPLFPKDRKDGPLRAMTVTRLLKKVVYAGYVEAPKWQVSAREGQHEGLISYETHLRILDHLDGRKRSAAARTDYNEDFPLRGLVLCNSCGNAMTAAWSSGCRKPYPYCRCMTRGCAEYSKSIPRRVLEGYFHEILKALTPTRQLFGLAKVMLTDAWNMRLGLAQEQRIAWQSKIKSLEREIEDLLDRIVDAQSRTVIRKLEERIDTLEKEQRILSERAAQALPESGQLEGCMELAMQFLASPWKIYKNGDYVLKRTVLKLTFSEPLRYCRREAYGTIKKLPFFSRL
ncbi:MAG: hypothetical protein AAGC79_12730 [Pseudomonadota bacterium]